jgi:hypothetical protein
MWISPRKGHFVTRQYWVFAGPNNLYLSAKLPGPHVPAEKIADDLRSALEQIESVLGDRNNSARDFIDLTERITLRLKAALEKEAPGVKTTD